MPKGRRRSWGFGYSGPDRCAGSSRSGRYRFLRPVRAGGWTGDRCGGVFFWTTSAKLTHYLASANAVTMNGELALTWTATRNRVAADLHGPPFGDPGGRLY